MKRIDVLSMGAAAALLISGCSPKAEPHRELKTTPPSLTKKIPGDQIPVSSMEKPGFMYYSGNPSADHVSMIRKICGEYSASIQGNGFVISTPYTPDCPRKLREQLVR